MILVPDYATDEWSWAAVKTISLDEQQVKESAVSFFFPTNFSRNVVDDSAQEHPTRT